MTLESLFAPTFWNSSRDPPIIPKSDAPKSNFKLACCATPRYTHSTMTHDSATRFQTSFLRRFFPARSNGPIETGWSVPESKSSVAHSVKACAFLLGYLAAYLAAGYGAIAVAERVWLALVP
jgi:hypothetical protein